MIEMSKHLENFKNKHVENRKSWQLTIPGKQKDYRGIVLVSSPKLEREENIYL